jgi:hypothetical protein
MKFLQWLHCDAEGPEQPLKHSEWQDAHDPVLDGYVSVGHAETHSSSRAYAEQCGMQAASSLQHSSSLLPEEAQH